MPDATTEHPHPWAWIPSLYVAEGLPYVVAMTVSVIMYKRFGVSNTDIALYTSWLYLPWVIKPLWSPVVDLLGTRRRWIWAMQLLIGAALAGVALAVPVPHCFRWTLAFFWLLAFDSATHDIAADGFYMLATTEKEQAFFVGIRSLFYRVATIAGAGAAGDAGRHHRDPHRRTCGWRGPRPWAGWPSCSWSSGSGTASSCRARRWTGPARSRRVPQFVREFLGTFGSFFRKPRIVVLRAVPAALPLRRGAAGQDGLAVPARPARAAAGWG